jgi:hypothetical protein
MAAAAPSWSLLPNARSVNDWRWWSLAAVPAFIALTLLLQMPSLLSVVVDGSAEAWRGTFVIYVTCWVFWIAIGPPLFWFFCRYPLDGGSITTKLALHFAAALAFVLIHTGMHAAIDTAGWFEPGTPIGTRYRTLLSSSAGLELIVFVMIDGAFHAVRYAVRARQSADRERELTHLKTRAELEALRRRLEPHFLFNALNSLCAMLPEGDQARQMAMRISDYLRIVLDRASSEKVPLREELAIVRSYLEIEEIRHGDRLDTSFSVDRKALDAQTPVMVLQPLVENAVRFATAGGASPARVMLKAQRQGDRLALTVSNSFRSDDGDLSGQGWGHAIIRERLTANYCDDADFRIETENGQFVVHVELPYEPHLACERPA